MEIFSPTYLSRYEKQSVLAQDAEMEPFAPATNEALIHYAQEYISWYRSVVERFFPSAMPVLAFYVSAPSQQRSYAWDLMA